MNTQTKIVALDAVTATTTSKMVPMGDFGRTSIQFLCTGHSSGNGVFTVEVSNDGTNWTAYNRLTTNATNTNAQTDLRAASVTLSSNTTSIVTIPDTFAYLRVICTYTTDGAYTATVITA